MNASELLRLIDSIHRDKNIEKEIVFQAIEAALESALKKQYGEEEDIVVRIDRADGAISGTHNGAPLDPDETMGRIAAQTAKQVIIQKVREAERDALYDEYDAQKDQLVSGVVQRYEGGAATVSLPNCEAILPRSEQIPGETHHANERVRATVCEVRKAGSRVKVILSRTRPALVARLFEQEIPEIADGVIEIKAMSREPGYRSKVAVSSTDQRVDSVGACVGVRGNRIKNIVDELAGERIDIVRWNEDMQVLIPNALQPAEADEVILCPMLGRAIVLVREDQLSLAIGRRGQNVRLASKLCGWDIEIMTREELDEQIDRAVAGFSSLTGVDDNLSEKLVGEGFLSYDDLSVIEPDSLMEMGGLSAEQTDLIVQQAEAKAEEAERAAADERRRQRAQDRTDAVAAADAATAADAAAEAGITGEAGASGEANVAEEAGSTGEDGDIENMGEENSGVEAVDETAVDETAMEEAAADESAADDMAEEGAPPNEESAGQEQAADEESSGVRGPG